MIKVAYTDANRDEIIASFPDKILVGDWRHIDGNYLLFINPGETEPYELEPDPPEPTHEDYLIDLDFRLCLIELGLGGMTQ